MTTSERAAQIWSVLALAARNRQILTYNMIAKLTGIAQVGLGQCLEPIQSYCLLRKLPPLSILVVREKSGLPGVGFIAAQDIPTAQQEVFSFDWLDHGGPSSDDFERAVRERPSDGIIQLPEAGPEDLPAATLHQLADELFQSYDAEEAAHAKPSPR